MATRWTLGCDADLRRLVAFWAPALGYLDEPETGTGFAMS